MKFPINTNQHLLFTQLISGENKMNKDIWEELDKALVIIRNLIIYKLIKISKNHKH